MCKFKHALPGVFGNACASFYHQYPIHITYFMRHIKMFKMQQCL